MRLRIWRVAGAAATLWMAGLACAAPQSPSAVLALPMGQTDKHLTLSDQISERLSDTLLRAMSFLGLPYRYGGASPETGFDCSGLVRWVFGDAFGMQLPRRSEEISRLGVPVTLEQLRPGDLVFFNTLRRTFSHVGIYLGQNRFIHSPSIGSTVRIEEITAPYWTRRFNGARRVAGFDTEKSPHENSPEAMRAQALLNGLGPPY